MADKKIPEKSEAGVTATIAACATKTKTSMSTDPADMGPRAAGVQTSLNYGGTAADIARAGRMSENMGRGVADAYNPNKKEDFWEGVGNKIGSITSQFTTAVNTTLAPVKEELKVAGTAVVMGGVSAATNDTPQVIRDQQARTQSASALVR